jgi:hypothetical protein
MTTTAGRALLDAMGRQPCDCVAHRHPAETIAAIEREAYEQATLDAARVPSDGLRGVVSVVTWTGHARDLAASETPVDPRPEHRTAGPTFASEAPVGLDAAYRERNALIAALIRSHGWRAEVVMAPDTEGWWIIYAETPQGQVSWHISPDDMDLFRDWPAAFGSRPSPWDGHTTEEKYRRIARLGQEGGTE